MLSTGKRSHERSSPSSLPTPSKKQKNDGENSEIKEIIDGENSEIKEIIEGENSEIKESIGVDSSIVPSLADGVRLRGFQLDDAERVLQGWMYMDSHSSTTKSQIKGVVLAHEMGLGKTLIAMSALSMDMHSLRHSLSALTKPPKIQALIVLPNSVLWNWNAELEKFFSKHKRDCPFKRVLVYHRTNTDINLPTNPKELENYDVVLTTYGTYESRFSLFNSIAWEYLCVDEAHHLRTQTTKGFELIRSLTCNKCLLLTGTPISNKVDDLCSLIDILGVPSRLAKRVLQNAMKAEKKAALDKIKKARHFVIGDDGEIDIDQEEEEEENDDKKENAVVDEKELSRARKKINTCVIRRQKKDVNPHTGKLILALPQKLLQNHVLPLVGADKDAYDEIESYSRREANRLLKQAEKGTISAPTLSIAMFAILTRLRMASDSCKIVKDLEKLVAPQIFAALSNVSPKISRAVEIINGLLDEGKKVVVFSQWLRFLNPLENEIVEKLKLVHCTDPKSHLRSDIKSFARIDGSVNVRERHQFVERFQSDPSCCVFLLSTMAGAEGITLTAAHNVIICDPWWNPQLIEQAVDRVHRMGQTEDVVVHYLLSEGTVDERVHALAGGKHAMATKVLGDGASESTKYWGKMQHGLDGSMVANLIFGEDEEEEEDEEDEDDDEFGSFGGLSQDEDDDGEENENEDGRSRKSFGGMSQDDSQDDSILFETW